MGSPDTVYLVRHAKAGERRTWNGDDVDRPLSRKGWRQSEAIAKRLSKKGVSALYSSSYLRCVQTLEPLGRTIDLDVRTDERLVDKFEEATKRLSLAARNPRHSNRLRDEWRKIQPLQFQVESTLFNKYTYNHQLFRAWDDVLYAQCLFYEEYLFTLDNPKHGNSVQKRIIRSRPERYVPPPPASSGRIYTDPRLQGR